MFFASKSWRGFGWKTWLTGETFFHDLCNAIYASLRTVKLNLSRILNYLTNELETLSHPAMRLPHCGKEFERLSRLQHRWWYMIPLSDCWHFDPVCRFQSGSATCLVRLSTNIVLDKVWKDKQIINISTNDWWFFLGFYLFRFQVLFCK